MFTSVAMNQVQPAQPVSCFCPPPLRPVTVLINISRDNSWSILRVCGDVVCEYEHSTSPFPALSLAVVGGTPAPFPGGGGWRTGCWRGEGSVSDISSFLPSSLVLSARDVVVSTADSKLVVARQHLVITVITVRGVRLPGSERYWVRSPTWRHPRARCPPLTLMTVSHCASLWTKVSRWLNAE